MTGRMNYVPKDLPADVRWGFTREGLYALPHHAHPIAHARGFAQKMMATYWPGLTWQQAMGLVSKTGVWVKRGNSFLGLDVADHVKELHLLIDGGHRVVTFESDETVPHKPSWAGASLLEAITPTEAATEGGRRAIARRILDRLAPGRDHSRDHTSGDEVR